MTTGAAAPATPRRRAAGRASRVVLGQLHQHDDRPLEALEAADRVAQDHVVGELRNVRGRRGRGAARRRRRRRSRAPRCRTGAAARRPTLEPQRRSAPRSSHGGTLLLDPESVEHASAAPRASPRRRRPRSARAGGRPSAAPSAEAASAANRAHDVVDRLRVAAVHVERDTPAARAPATTSSR